jgi:hypothetical protein
MENTIECYGCITKVEKLWCIEEFGIPHTCLLESHDIFPGYYDRFTRQIKPRYVYIMSKEKLSLEQVTRLTGQIKSGFDRPFDAAYCEISIGNEICGGVRIAGVDDYGAIKELQDAYEKSGLSLKKKVRNIENTEAVIKIRKFFQLEVFSDNVFIDKKQTDIGYFKVPEDLPWEQFVSNIVTLRNNWNDNAFDAAKSFIYQQSMITDLVRIYSKDITGEFLEKLRSAYLKYSV